MTEDASVDQAEIDQFDALAAQWWQPDGPFAPLHRMNPVRLGYIREALVRHFRRKNTALQPFEGLDILDLGCGGGLISEPLARLGANVTGVDAGAENIKAANAHAALMGLDIDYRASSAEDLCAKGADFDAVLILEILEHVADVPAFLNTCRRLLRPGGILLFSTLDRSAKSFLSAIIGAEYLLGWVPRGTHDWRKFLRPQEVTTLLETAGFREVDIKGLIHHPLSGRWEVGNDSSVNYIGHARPGERA